MSLQVENFSVTFSNAPQPAVQNVSFTIQKGAKVALVGESGSGKSALVQAFLRLNSTQTSGKVFYNDENLLEKSDVEMTKIRGKEIGIIFQDPFTSLNPTMKIKYQIAEGLIHHKLAKKEAFQIVRQWLQNVNLPHVEECYPHTLSGGEKQRVQMAIALSLEPQLLIADEPTTALDPILSAQILNILESFDRTLLLITHDFRIVSKICDQIIVFYAGKIVEMGSVDQVLLHPKHPYTEMLLKSIPHLNQPKSEKLFSIESPFLDLSQKNKGCPFASRCPYAMDICKRENPILENGVACFKSKISQNNSEKRRTLISKEV